MSEAQSERGPLKTELRDAILIVTIDRAQKRNAMNDGTVHAFDALFSNIPKGVEAIVIQGDGPNFSAGLDLSELTERNVTEGIAHSMMWHRCFEKIQFGTVPVISVLKGAVIGGGLELACATHIRVAESTAFYALPEGTRGIYVGGGASVRLPRIIGVHRMMDLMMTGRVFDANEGQNIGLSNYLVGEGEGLERAIAIATRVTQNAPLTNFALMHALPRIAESDPASGYLTEALMAAVAQGSDEAKKRLRDFLEKRAEKVGVKR